MPLFAFGMLLMKLHLPAVRCLVERVRRCPWLLLVAAQLLVCGIVFWRFIAGNQYFAYLDIGSDSFKAYVPYLMLWSSYVRDVGLTGWSFQIGLGGPVVQFLDPFSWVSVLAGADHVLALRVWLMIARLLVAGWAVYAILRRLSVGADSAVIGALMYSFCGYAQIDAQWDHMANELVFYPLVLLGVLHRLQGGHFGVLTAVVAGALISNVFFVSLSVFLGLVFVASLICTDRPREVAVAWSKQIVPPVLTGVALAGPVLAPYVLQLLDSPRVTGSQSLFSQRLAELFSVNDWTLVLIEVSGLFSKNLLGVGSRYAGWGNYLEGPGFYIGTLGLLIIPQIWLGGTKLRRVLVVAAVAIVLYFVFPAFRYAAFGFAIQYFRVSTLWITMLLLVLSVLALDVMLRQGVNRPLLIGGAVFSLAVPTLLRLALPVVPAAYFGWLAFSGFAFALLYAASFFRPGARWLGGALLCFVALESGWTAYQSVNAGRVVVDARTPGYSDLSGQVVKRIKERDRGVYRLEKSYAVSDNDALAQNYFGVQSYAFHGSSVVRLHTSLGTIPASGRGVNYTNWLPDFGGRFLLYSWVGVKYFLSHSPVSWPGFVEIGRLGDVLAYRNELAFPLGVLYDTQVSEQEVGLLPLFDRDRLLLHAVATDHPLPEIPVASALQVLAGAGLDSGRMVDRYVEQARAMQSAGLSVSSFEQNRIVGTVESQKRAVLVYSIPFSSGWRARVDGRLVSTFRANFGFTALLLDPGKHQVELEFRPPGLATGMFLAGLGLLLVFALGLREYRSRSRRRDC